MWNRSGDSEDIFIKKTAFSKQIYQWQALTDDHAEKDVIPEDFE